jgi:hypothetical protein
LVGFPNWKQSGSTEPSTRETITKAKEEGTLEAVQTSGAVSRGGANEPYYKEDIKTATKESHKEGHQTSREAVSCGTAEDDPIYEEIFEPYGGHRATATSSAMGLK